MTRQLSGCIRFRAEGSSQRTLVREFARAATPRGADSGSMFCTQYVSRVSFACTERCLQGGYGRPLFPGGTTR